MCYKFCIKCGTNIEPSRTGCGIESAVGLCCLTSIRCCVPVGLCPIVTLLHTLLKGGLFSLSQLCSYMTSRRRVVWVSQEKVVLIAESICFKRVCQTIQWD